MSRKTNKHFIVLNRKENIVTNRLEAMDIKYKKFYDTKNGHCHIKFKINKDDREILRESLYADPDAGFICFMKW